MPLLPSSSTRALFTKVLYSVDSFQQCTPRHVFQIRHRVKSLKICIPHVEFVYHVFDTNEKLGDLQSVDGYMNIALERCKEWANGKVVRSWGDAFVRGNNGESH